MTDTSKIEIENISTSHKTSVSYVTDYSHLTKKVRVKKAVIDVNNNSKLGLQIILNIEDEPKIINLNYIPKKNEWDNNKKELKWNHPYYFTIISITKYIQSFKDIEKAVKNIETQIEIEGISKLAQFLFDWGNEGNDIPKYSYFIEAFEHFLKSKGKESKTYELQTVGEVIYFRTEDEDT